MNGTEAHPSATHDPPATRQRLAHWLFRAYKQWLSAPLHSLSVTQCKYLPTCSEYALVAVVRHGWWRGGWLAVRRVSRCHPFARQAADPVP